MDKETLKELVVFAWGVWGKELAEQIYLYITNIGGEMFSNIVVFIVAIILLRKWK